MRNDEYLPNLSASSFQSPPPSRTTSRLLAADFSLSFSGRSFSINHARYQARRSARRVQQPSTRRPHVITDPLDHSENANESPDVRIVPPLLPHGICKSKALPHGVTTPSRMLYQEKRKRSPSPLPVAMSNSSSDSAASVTQPCRGLWLPASCRRR